jgi:hypothetical protein
MSEFIFHNVYLRDVALLLLAVFVFFGPKIRNRKPGASIWAACFKSDSLTKRGLRAQSLGAAALGIIAIWAAVAVACEAP